MPRGQYDRTNKQRGLRVVRQEQVAPRNPAASEETRRERTLRLGPARLAAAQKAIRHLRQLANPTTYDLRPEEPELVVKALRSEVEALEFELKNPGKLAVVTGVFQRE